MGTQLPLPPQFSVRIYCGQTAGWIKMPLGVEVGLGRGHIVRDGHPARSKKGHSLQFSAHACCDQTAGCITMPLRTEVGLGPGDIVLDGDPAPPKRGTAPIFSPCPLWPKGWMDKDATWYESRPRPRSHCVRWGPSSSPILPKGDKAPRFLAHGYCVQTVAHLSYC